MLSGMRPSVPGFSFSAGISIAIPSRPSWTFSQPKFHARDGARAGRQCEHGLPLIGRIAAPNELRQGLEIAIVRGRVGINGVAELERSIRLFACACVIRPDFLDRRFLRDIGETHATAGALGEAV